MITVDKSEWKSQTVETRFLAKIIPPDEDEHQEDCWIWAGARLPRGYGRLGIDGRQFLAHRVSYALYRGEVPNDLLVCHTCDVPSCVNPDHLFLGTAQDNIRDAVNKGRQVPALKERTHCPRGHEYTEENTYIGNKPGAGRQCRVCRSIQSRKRTIAVRRGLRPGRYAKTDAQAVAGE